MQQTLGEYVCCVVFQLHVLDFNFSSFDLIVNCVSFDANGLCYHGYFQGYFELLFSLSKTLNLLSFNFISFRICAITTGTSSY